MVVGIYKYDTNHSLSRSQAGDPIVLVRDRHQCPPAIVMRIHRISRAAAPFFQDQFLECISVWSG